MDIKTQSSLSVTCQWFSPVSSNNKTDRHNIIEILLKVALNTTNQTKPIKTSHYTLKDCKQCVPITTKVVSLIPAHGQTDTCNITTNIFVY